MSLTIKILWTREFSAWPIMGITSALVGLSKTESKNMKELIARVLNAVCKHTELRGMVVQQGGTKVLAKLALDGTEKGMRHAAQALARIGITQVFFFL